MYSTVEEIRLMLKDHVLEHMISNEYIEDAAEKERETIQIVSDAIEDADSEIDGYLAKRYKTPLSPCPPVINKYSKDIAIYNIMSRSGIDTSERESNYLTRYKHAIKYLENVAKGIVNVPGASGSSLSGDDTPPGSRGSKSDFRICSSTKIFGRSNMEGY